MNKSVKFLVILISAVFLVVAVSQIGINKSEAAQDKVYKLRMQVLFGPNMMWQYEPFIKYCKEASNGRLIIEPYAGGQLVPTDQMMQACSMGTLDIAGGAGGYWSEVIPVAGCEATLPFALRTITDVNTFYYQRGFLELCREGYAKHNVYYLGPQMVDFAYIMAKNPVRTLEDLKKLKFRAVPNIGKMLGKVGVSAQYVAAEEVYMAISTGVLDGVIYGGAVAAESMSFQEVAPYYMVPSINPANQNLIMSMSRWKSLPKDLQTILELATQAENLYLQTVNWNLEYEVRKKMMEKNGLKVVEMDDALVKSLTKVAMEFWDEVAKKGPLANKAVDMMKSYLRDVRYID
jgi:TRAP-type mannitol/chloroaromatic compound transport system substrate-binding protein